MMYSYLKRFVPAPVLNSMTAGTGNFDYTAEIRQVILICNIVHYKAYISILAISNFSVSDHYCLLAPTGVIILYTARLLAETMPAFDVLVLRLLLQCPLYRYFT
jgi:hypothetical protein